MNQTECESKTLKLKSHLKRQKYAYLVGVSSLAVGMYAVYHAKGALNNLSYVIEDFLKTKDIGYEEFSDYLLSIDSRTLKPAQ